MTDENKKPSMAMASEEKAMKEYPKTRLLEKQAITSLITPNPGRIIM